MGGAEERGGVRVPGVGGNRLNVFALSDAATTGLFALGVAIVGAIVSLVGILVTHDTRRQNRQTSGSVSVLEAAVARQLDAQSERINSLEEREQDCLDAVQAGLQRIAVLEERLGMNRDDGT